VPQETHLAFEYTVLEVVLMGRYPHLGAFEIEGPRDIALARKALAATGTSALEPRGFATLSGGEKQRVIIAAALAQISASERTASSPAVLLLDEPTAALDLKYQLETASLLRDLHQAHALSVVISTHDLNFAAALCETLVMLKEGQVLASGSVDDVLTPALIRQLYDVEAEVSRHAGTGHLLVVPVSRSETRPV
jgi:iron complex transport system ATP-binding protein